MDPTTRATGTRILYPRSKSPNIPIPKPRKLEPWQRVPFAEISPNSFSPPDTLSVLELEKQVKGLTLDRFLNDRIEIQGKIAAVGQEFHGLTQHESKRIAKNVVIHLSDTAKKGTHLERKNLDKTPRTIFYDYDNHAAYVFLKTKGKLPEEFGGGPLPENKGGYRRGTRALRITWAPARYGKAGSGVAAKVEHAFQLVSHDIKATSHTAHEVPFEVMAKKELTEAEFNSIKDVFTPCYTFFTYQKIGKLAEEPITKSCRIYPFQPASLHDMLQFPDSTYESTLSIVYDVVKQLNALHKVGIIHADVKFSNILVTKDGYGKLADFDFATLFKKGDSPAWATGFYGTYTHSAPELLRQEKEVALPKTDIYALGKDLFSLGFDRNPPWIQKLNTYKHYRLIPTLEEVVELQDELARECDRAVKDIGNTKSAKSFIQKLALLMLHPDPEKRISAAEAVIEIERFLKQAQTKPPAAQIQIGIAPVQMAGPLPGIATSKVPK